MPEVVHNVNATSGIYIVPITDLNYLSLLLLSQPYKGTYSKTPPSSLRVSLIFHAHPSEHGIEFHPTFRWYTFYLLLTGLPMLPRYHPLHNYNSIKFKKRQENYWIIHIFQKRVKKDEKPLDIWSHIWYAIDGKRNNGSTWELALSYACAGGAITYTTDKSAPLCLVYTLCTKIAIDLCY